MANTFGNPIVIDTPGATSTVNGRIRVIEIRWVGATAPAHQALVTDPVSSLELWRDVAPGAQYVSHQLVDKVWKHGFTVTTLGSGKLFITVG